MITSQNGLELIKYFEGFSAQPYICPAGFMTIGYGHVIKRGEALSQVSEQQAEDILRKDVITAEKSVLRNIIVPLNQNQFDALVSFTFNLGGGSLQRSTLRRKLNYFEYWSVPHELKRWIKSNGKILRGLVARRQAEADLFNNYRIESFN